MIWMLYFLESRTIQFKSEASEKDLEKEKATGEQNFLALFI